MGKHSGLLHVEYLRQERARQKRAFLKQFVLGASPLVLGALVNAGLPQTAQAQAVNLNPSVNNIIADGRTRTKITTSGTHSRITTDTVSNGVGFNSFSDFQQAAGTRVDLMVPDAAGNLVNMVSNGAVVINGELNAFKDGSIGGNIFFSSPDGFIVGQNGRVNVGSLAVNTPTQAFLDRVIRSDGSINDAVANQLMRGEIPVSPNGHIAIMGEINAKGSITLQGQTVSVTGDSGPVTGEDFGHRTMFNSTVNAQGMVEGGALVSSGGRISIVAAGGSRINGRVDASAPTAASKGGEVSITGGDIAVGSDATVSADGDAGGEIVVFADGTLVAQDGATFSAAGIGAGDGGFIELSGRDAHIGSVNIDLSSVSGRAGTFLIDPFDLVIAASTSILSGGANIELLADNSITIAGDGVLDSRMLDGAGFSSGDSGDITLEAPQITLEDGSKVLAGVTTGLGFTGGDVVFDAVRTEGGTAQITIGGGGASGPELTGRNITLTASSTVDQSNPLLAIPTATAKITANSGTIDASGTFTATATATGGGGAFLLPLGVVVTNVTSEVDIKGSTDLTAAAVDVDATSSVSSMILTQSLAPVDSSADGAVAVSTINSTAIARVGGAATLDVAGATDLNASNTVTSTSDATPQAAAFGASVGVSVINAITTAEIADAAAVSTGTLGMDATTSTETTVKAVAGAGGATEPSPGSQATTYLTDAKYGGQATTSDGGVSVAGALAISDLTSTTNARINSSAATTVTGALSVSTSSGNKADVIADGTAVTSDTGVGVALGINIAKVVNDAVISSAVNAGSAALSAARPTDGNAFTTSATSGAGAANVGLAGSFALNLVDTQSIARLAGSSVVTIAGSGAVSLSSDNATESSAKALPSSTGATGDTVGVGAGIAMNIVANRSYADVADDAVVTDAGDLTLSAAATHVAETEAEAGSSGGISLTPALALSLITNTTTARLGTGGTQEVTGAVSVSAAQHSTITTEASGKAAGSKAAIGASLALALVDDRVLATTARNVDADGAVSFSAAGASLSTLEAEASAVGAAPAEDDGTASDGGDVDTTTTQSLESGSSKQKAAGVGDSEQQGATDTAVNDEDSKDSRSAETSEGKVSVAAAVGINVQTSSVKAEIPDNITISAGGVLKLAAINNTDGKIEAVGDAVGKPDAAGETPPPSQVGIGAAVAVNVVKVRNDATLGDAAHSTGGVTLSASKLDVADFMANPASTATRGDVFLAKASSGAGASKVGVAGSVALNLIDTQSVARISGGATVTLTGGGNVSLTTDNQTEATAEALPVGGGASGATVGVGASVALNILANRSVAEVADGAVVTDAGDLTLSAAATHVAETKAEAGSSGGISVTPALALSLITNTTTARLGTGGTQEVTGAVSVSAAQHSTITTEASGKAAGTKAAIGASLALAIIDDRALATTARNIDADGAVSFNASGVSSSTLTAVASAAGAKDAEDEDAALDSDGESVDKTANKEFEAGAGKQSTAGVGDVDQQGATNTAVTDKDSKDSRSAKTSEGKVAVAAAVAINVQKQTVEAVVPDGVDITAGGSITVASGATTGGEATSDGQAVKGEDGGTSQVGIGVAVSVNVVQETNTAYLGSGTHAGAGVNVRALQATGAATDTFLTSATSGAGGSKVGIAGSVALNIVTLDTTARISGGASVAAGAGVSTIEAGNAVSATATAEPSDEGGAAGGKVGVGASFAMNLLTTTTTAELQDGATMTGGAGLSVSATSGLDTTTEASAGAAGGIAVDASVALALLNQTTIARIGTGNDLTMGAGALSVIATNTGTNTATSTGENKSDKVGVGASASVILGNGASGGALNNTSLTSAVLARSATAGAVTIEASANRTYDAHATATAGGGVFSSSDDKKQNDKTDGTSTTADSLDKTKDSQRDENGNKPSGAKTITIAAAAGIAAAQDVVTAKLEGVTINASGAVSVTATNEVGMATSGIGLASDPKSKVGIGVGVGLAILNNTTSAIIADSAEINTDAAGLTVAATSRENAEGDYLSKLSALGIAGASGKQVSVAGSLAVAISTGTTEAKIGDDVEVTDGGAMAVTVDNKSHLSAKALAGSLSTGGTAVGGSIAVVVSEKEYEASVGADSALTGSALSVTAINSQIDDPLTGLTDEKLTSLDNLDAFAGSLADLATGKLLGNSNYYVEAIGGAGGSGLAVQGSFGVMVFSDTLTASVGSNADVDVGTGAVTLSAGGDFVAKSLSGALSASTSSAAVGVSSTVVVSDGTTTSSLGENSQITSAGSFSNTASAKQDIRSYAASASAASSAGVSGVAGVVTSENRVEALMARGAEVTISGAGAVSLGATNDFDIFGLAAGVGVGSSAGIGAAATVVVVNNITRAALADGTSSTDRAEINTGGAVSITATATEDGDLFSVAGAAGSSGVGAGAGIYVLGTTTEALVGDYAKVGNAYDSGSLEISASDTSTLFAASGAAGVGGTAGVGAGVAVGVLTKTTTAEIGASARVASGNVVVDAQSWETLTNITAGVGVGGKAGLAGAVTVLSVTPTTTARIGQLAEVHANGNVAVLADGKTVIDMLDGAFGGSGAAGVGASVGVTVIDATTIATVDANAEVTALGNGGDQEYTTGYTPSFSTYGDDEGFTSAEFDDDPDEGATSELTDASAATARATGLDLLAKKRTSTPTTATARGVIVNASDKASVRSLSVAGSAGAVGVSISAGLPVITTNTKAEIAAGAKINQITGTGTPATAQDVTVAAASDIYALGFSGAVAGGGVAVGAGFSVMVIDATTEALVGAGTMSANGDVAVTARSTQDIVGVGVAGAAAGSDAIAGGISVFDVTTKTRAQLAGTVTAQGDVDVIADDKTRTSVLAGALAIGGSTGVGGAISVVNLNKEIDAAIASGATVTAFGQRGNHTIFTGDDFSDERTDSRGVNVQSNSLQSGFTLAAAGAAAGNVGVAGVLTLYLMSVTNTASIGNDASINTATGTDNNAAQDVVVTARDETVTSVAAGGVAAGALGGVAGVVDVGVFKNTAAASIGNNVTLNAERDVRVSGLSNKAGEAYVMGAGGGIVGLAAGIAIYNYGDGVAPNGEADKNIGDASDDGTLSFASITREAQAQAKDGTANDQLAASDDTRISGVSAAAQNKRNQIDVVGATDTLSAPAGTSATIGSGTIDAGGTVSVKSSDGLNVKMTTGAVAAGGFAGGAGIGVLTVDTGSTAKIDGTGTMEAGAVNVNALTDHTLYGLHFAGAGGLAAAVSADVGIHTDNSRTTAAIRGKEITTGGAVAVNADSTRDLTVDAIGGSFGGVAVGASVGEATVGGAVSASISDDATIGSNTGRAASVSVTASATSTADTEAYAVGGGIGAALQGAGSIATVKPSVTASVDSARIYSSGLTEVNATATGSVDTEAVGIAVAGGLAAGASAAESEVASEVSTTVANGSVIDAGSITIGTSAGTGGVNSKAIGAAGALVGLNATVTKSLNSTNAITSVTGSTLRSPGGTTTVSASNTTNQYANGSGLAVGFVAAGFNISEARSDTTTSATLSNLALLTADTLNVTATGTDNNNAVTVAGSGGVVAGSAATSKTSTRSTTRAAADTTGAAGYGVIVGRDANISAQHTTNFGGSVDSTQASLVGASGATLDHFVSSDVDAEIGDQVQLSAANLTLSARNITSNPFLAGGANNVKSISGGLANVPAGGATVTIIHNTAANVGANAAVRLHQPGTGPSLYKQEAYNDISSAQKVNLDSGGAIALADAVINSGITANATASVGSEADVEVDYGDIQIAAWGEADIDMRASATTYGLAGAPSGDANITYTGANTVTVGNDALVQATDGDNPTNGDMPRYATVYIGAGTGPAGQTARLGFNAIVDLFNKTAIPIPSAPNPTVTVTNSGIITVGTTDSDNMNTDPQGVRAAGDIHLAVSRGEIDARAVGTGKDIYREELAKAASAVSNAFGGGDVTFDYHGGSTNTGGGVARVDVEGRVETGIQRHKLLTLDLKCEAGLKSCIDTNSGDNIEFDLDGPFDVGTNILERVAELEQLIKDYDTDPIAKAAYQNEINFLHNKLVGLGLGSFDADGKFEPGTYAGPSPKALALEQVAGFTGDIEIVESDLAIKTSLAEAVGLGDTIQGYVDVYETATNGLIATVDATITSIEASAPYDSDSHGSYVTAAQNARDAGKQAAADAKTAQDDINTLRGEIAQKTQEIEEARDLLTTALVDNDTVLRDEQNGIIDEAQTAIATKLTDIEGHVATLKTKSEQAKNHAATAKTKLDQLLDALYVPVPDEDDDNYDTAIDTNDQVDALKSSLTSESGSLTKVAYSASYLADEYNGVNDEIDGETVVVTIGVKNVADDLTADIGTLKALPSEDGTIGGNNNNSLSQFVGLLKDLTTYLADATRTAATASNSSGTPRAYNIEIADTVARLGNIFVTGDQLRTSGAGQLLAPGDAKIQITNTTHHTLELGNLIVPTYDAGNLRFNGVLVHSGADITSLNAGGVPSGFNTIDNVVTSRTSSRGLVEILSTYTPESITDVDDRKIAPDIILKRGSVIENTNGAVRIISEAGNIYIRGQINAGSVEILAKDGDFVASYVNGFNHIGGDPASFEHPEDLEQGPGITANGAISISARYLNINSTIQSGIAEWNLTLNSNPTLTASASAIGVDPEDEALVDKTEVENSAGQMIKINRAPPGVDEEELALVVEQYKEEVLVDPNANPVRTITINDVPTQVNIKDYLSDEIKIRLEFTKEQADAFAAATLTSDGIFSVVNDSTTDNIGASYDAREKQYFVNGASVKGGYIQLFGQIMNTASSTAVGKLNVLDGFGTINIHNASNIPVVLRNLSAGEDPTGTLRGVEGKIEITDVVGLTTTDPYSPKNPLINVRKTVFTRDYVPGDDSGSVKIETRTGTIVNETGELNLGGVTETTGSDRSTIYTPGTTNQRYVWTTGEEFKSTSNYKQTSTELFGSSSLTVDRIWDLTKVGTPLLLSTYRLADGTYVTTNKTINGGGLVEANGAYFQDPPATESLNSGLSGTPLTEANQSTFTKNDFVKTGESSRKCNWWTLCIASEKTRYYELRQEYTTIITESLKADYPIGVNFIGSNTGAINITSATEDVVLTSNLNAVAGTVTINAGTTAISDASIIQGTLAAEIKAKNISLTADASVGGVTDLRNTGAPTTPAMTVNLTGTQAAGFGALSANAKAGNVSIISRGDIVVDQVTASGLVADRNGRVDLFSYGSIDGKDQNARIQAPRVSLNSMSGSVGNTADNSLLRVNTGFTTDPADRPFGDPEVDLPAADANAKLGLSITAAGDIGVRSDGWAGNTDGNSLVVKVQTTGGDVRLAATGQILDNNPVQSIDERTYDQLLGFWESLGLLADDPSRGVDGSVNAAKQANAISAFEASTTQTYNQYWRIRGDAAYDPSATVEITDDSAQYRALDAQFRAEAIEAGEADVDAFVEDRIADVELQQTTEYHRLHGVVGDLTASYDADFTYTATDEQKADLTRGSVWTERELAFSLAPGALKTVTGTNPVLKDPNVSGRTVTIEAGLGIGETIGAGTTGPLGVSILSSMDPRDLTLDQKVALASAERNDLQLTLGPVHLPADATPEQIAAYDAAKGKNLHLPGALTSLNLGAELLSDKQQAALDAAALGLVAPEHTLLTVLSKRPLNFNAVTALNIDVPDVSDGSNADIGSAFLASRGAATLGSISTYGDTRIKVFGNIANASSGIVQTGNLILEAAQGSIGTTITPLNLSLRDGSTTTARAQNGVNIAFTNITLNASGLIDTVYSPQAVKLVAQDSLLNAQNDELINVLGAQVELEAVTGSIGTVARSLNVGVGLGGQITAKAAQEINLFGPANSLFIIGSAKAGSIIRLTAAGEGVIDGLVKAPGDITIATGGRTLFTALGDVHSTAGLVDINSASLKMLNGAKILANAGQVTIATTGDALVTGITSEIALADAVSVTAGGRIFAGTSDPRTDITAMSVGAGVYLSAGLGIGHKTQANTSALDNTVTDVANPLRIRTHTLEAEATDGGIALHALTAMELTSLTAPNGTIDVTGDDVLTVTSAQSGGSQSFTAEGNLTFVSLETTGIPAVPGPEDAGDVTLVSVTGDVEGDQINANGSADLTGNEVDFNSITTGADTKILARTGAVTGVDVDAGGSSEITGTGITVTRLKAGVDSTLTGGTGPVNILTSLNAGGNSTITGNGVKFDTIKAGLNSEIYSTGDIIGDLEEAGETIINIAGFGPGNSGILDVKVMRAKNIHLQATGTLDVGTLEVAQNLSLRADIIRALDITQVPSGPDPLNVTLTGPDGTVATFAQVNIDSPAGVVMPQVFVSETLMTTTAQFVDVVNAIVPIQGTSPMAGTFLLTTPSQTVFVDDRTQTPKTNPPSNIQMYLNGNPFTMTLDGIATSTDSFVVVYDDTVELTDVLGLPYDGISLVRDTVRQMWNADDPIILPGSFGSFGLGNGEEDDDDFDLSQFDGTLVEIDGIEYSVVVRGNGPAVLLRQ
ncbi:leukotoxin LktA family filamentous adhesin [Sinisalibacter lacisalsi]|uniref:Leukotoxin LktA family filamentous adhesin n=1 Tax=Sinisalibacter lacisalsi TaxID=1526570 RepID=A0ABQ1QXE9_9RHOB|nr:leukotoxin LktA family filamentous adhesin [Sinisalibacter lacisalsi]GGD47721.1 hypothetical protein GCM10011358_34410 [Sinisalibacter lacisalsi]